MYIYREREREIMGCRIHVESLQWSTQARLDEGWSRNATFSAPPKPPQTWQAFAAPSLLKCGAIPPCFFCELMRPFALLKSRKGREKTQMAQSGRNRLHFLDYCPGKHHLPASNLHPHKGVSSPRGHWSAPTTPTFREFYDHEDYHHHHAKKSVLVKVKEKARKWRQMLLKKRHGQGKHNPTPPWGVSLDAGLEEEDEHPRHHGASVSESETAPYAPAVDSAPANHSSPQVKSTVTLLSTTDEESETMQKDEVSSEQPASDDHLGAVKELPIPDTTVVPAAIDKAPMKDESMDQKPAGNSNKTLSETVTEILTPAYAAVSEATQAIASKFQGSSPRYEMVAKQVWDKGVSMKEYLMQKLEPGEEDRALCEVITGAVSPRNVSHGCAEAGAVKTREEAVSSLTGKEESEGSPIPVSTNPHAGM
ncbi:unnamed protein product [Musa hybrid cultivar]